MDTPNERPGSGNEALVAMDFVYCGRRLLDNNKLAVCLAPIKDDQLLDKRLYLFERRAHRAVGGVYAGAQFTESKMNGFTSNLTYLRSWGNIAEVIDWQARDAHAEATVRTRKLESDAKKVSEIEKIMHPLRAQFAAYRVKRDHAGMEALRRAVLAALESAPRSFER